MSISLNYLPQFPILNMSLNTIPMAILILGLTEFLRFQLTLDWGLRKVFNFISWSSFKTFSNTSQDIVSHNSCKNQELKLPHKKQPGVGEKMCDAGSVTCCREEVEMVMQSLGIFFQPEEEGGMVQERLSSDDLVSLFEENKNHPRLDEVREAFEVFDKNTDGFIDAEELQRVLLALGFREGSELENCKRMIRAFDENNDERIDFNEFTRFMGNIDS